MFPGTRPACGFACPAGLPGDLLAANANVKQAVEVLPEEAKLPRLLKMLGPWCLAGRGAALPKALVFANTKAAVARLCGQLQQAGAAADCLHGERDQRVRSESPAGFAAVCAPTASAAAHRCPPLPAAARRRDARMR